MKKTILFFLSITLLAPVFSFAQSVPRALPVYEEVPRAIVVDENTLQPIPRAIPVDVNSQAYQSIYGTTGSNANFGNPSSAAGGLGSCAAASGISGMIKSSISGFTSSILSAQVPVDNVKGNAKEVGDLASAGISWDGFGYCMVNALIEYIGQSTVQWINSGFQGNPVFVDDPEQFFSDIADIEAGNFLNDLSSGYLCSPYQTPIKLGIANSYNNSISPYSDRARCSFTGISGSLEQFISGETFSWEDWMSYTRPNNNQSGSFILAQIELDQRIANSLGTQSQLLDWGRGFQSPRDPETGKIKSPGSVIEEQINRRLGNSESRILMADEFDEIITALFNQLVKISITELTNKN